MVSVRTHAHVYALRTTGISSPTLVGTRVTTLVYH